MKTSLSLLVLSLALLGGCGKDDKKDRDDNAGEETNSDQDPNDMAGGDSLLVDDEDAAGEAVTAQIDDAISAAVEENDADAGASLLGANGDGKLTLFRECKEDGATAVVDVRREAERTVTAEGPVRKAESVFSAYYEKHRTWSKDGGEVKCGPAQKFAAIPAADMQGVKLDVTFQHERSRQVSLENKNKGTKAEKSFSYSADGDRHVIWKTVTEDGNYLLQKEVTGTANRKLDVQKKDGTKTTLESTITSAEGAPLEVLVERDHATLAWVSRTIQSGKRIATGKDGGRVELTFADVKYTAEKRCTAVSGKITGEIYEPSETTPAVTFEINFDGDDQTVTMSNGKEFDYSPAGCDLDETATAVEAATADDVQPAAAG